MLSTAKRGMLSGLLSRRFDLAIRIRLADGREVLVQATLDELEAALRAARERNQLVRVEQPDGTVVAISPEAVETLQEDQQAAAGLAERLATAAG